MRNLLWEYTVQIWQTPCLKKSQSGKAQSLLFCGKNGYECYESQVADWYFSNINDPETYKEIPGNHFIEKYV